MVALVNAHAQPNRLVSTITCPRCGHSETEAMPTDPCQFFYDRTACGALLGPKGRRLLVFCSFGDAPCPPKQKLADETPCGC
jgi:hypothetical protein